MLPFINKQPVAVTAAVRAVLYSLILLGVIQIDEQQLAGIAIALEAVLGLFVWNAVTTKEAPRLETGAEVEVLDGGQPTGDTVVIQPTPPGPIGVEDGAAG